MTALGWDRCLSVAPDLLIARCEPITGHNLFLGQSRQEERYTRARLMSLKAKIANPSLAPIMEQHCGRSRSNLPLHAPPAYFGNSDSAGPDVEHVCDLNLSPVRWVVQWDHRWADNASPEGSIAGGAYTTSPKSSSLAATTASIPSVLVSHSKKARPASATSIAE